MGPCICIHGDNDSSILYFKNEKKKLLPSFPYDGDEYKLKTPEKKSNVDTNEDTKGKITPASLLFYQEESPILPKKEDNIRAPSFDQFHIRKVLGKGSFGKVLLVEQKFSGKL